MENKRSAGLSLPTVLFLIFLILKLTNNIDWSWWWVTSPLWIPIVLILSITVIIITVLFLAVITGFTNLNKLKSDLDKFLKK
jgi:hypothetical protein